MRARRPDFLHPHLRKVLLDPILHPLAVVGGGAVLLDDVMMISGYLSASFQHYILIFVLEIFKLSFNIVNSALIDVSIAHFLFHGTSGAESTYCHGSCSFLLIQLCSNVYYCFYLCFGRQLRRFEAKEFIKNIFFNATVKL
jgi:hypothetical protein